MGCNCGRRRGTAPTGLTSKKSAASTSSTTSTGSATESKGRQSFALQTPNGTQTYGSRLERDAARARLGR